MEKNLATRVRRVVWAAFACSGLFPLIGGASTFTGTITYAQQAGNACAYADGATNPVILVTPVEVVGTTADAIVLAEDGQVFLLQRSGAATDPAHSAIALEAQPVVETASKLVFAVSGKRPVGSFSCRLLSGTIEVVSSDQPDAGADGIAHHLAAGVALAGAQDLLLAGRYSDAFEQAKRANHELVAAGAGPRAQRNAARLIGAVETARGNVDAAVRALEAVCGEAPRSGDVLAVNCRLDLVNALLLAGPTVRALDVSRETIAAAEATPSLAPVRRIRARTQFADTLRERGHSAEALGQAKQAVAEAEAAYGETNPILGRALVILAGIQYESGDPQSMATAERSLKVYEATLGPKHGATYSVKGFLAATYRDFGRRMESVAVGEAAYRGLRETLGPNHVGTLSALNNVAGSYQVLGLDREALAMYSVAEEGFRTQFSPTHPGRLIAWRNQANIFRSLNDPASALEIDMQLVKLMPGAFGEQHAHSVKAYGDVGRDLQQLGRSDEAVAWLTDGIARATAAQGASHRETLTMRLELARAYRAQGRYEMAIAEAAEVQSLAVGLYSAANFEAINAEGLLAEIYEDTGRRADATRVLEHNIVAIEEIRATRGLSPALRQSFLSIYVKRYRMLAKFYLDAGRVEDFFRLIELTKSRTLAESLSARRAEDLAGLSPRERGELSALQARIAELESKAATSDAEAQLVIGAQRSETVAELDRLRAGLRAKYPRYAALENPPIETTKSAKALLDRSTALVSYAFVEGRVAAVTLTGDGPARLHDLGAAHGLAEAVNAFRALVLRSPESRVWRLADGTFRIAAAAPDPAAREVVAAGEVGTYLAARLLEPLEAVLRGRRTWLIVPDGELALLPFDALPFAGGRALDRYDVGYIASVSVLSLLRERASRPRAATQGARDLLSVGAPEYTALKASEPQTDVAHPYRSLGVTWAPLPGALREVNAVARSFPGSKTLLLTGADASEARLAELNGAGGLKRYRYLHFATHGYLSPLSPQLSAVVLSQVGNPPGVDGYLTAAEWVGYDLDSDLIVLSGCNTGVGERVQGEGVTGLPYALVLAGNRSTMLTLWPVVDDSAARLVVGVFAGIRRGRSPLRALADAKRELSSRSQTADPLHWAAFVYYGR